MWNNKKIPFSPGQDISPLWVTPKYNSTITMLWCHVMWKASNNIARIAMHWTPEGKRSRGRPKTTWRRTVEKRLRGLNYSWSTIEKLAKDRQGWKDFVAALCATQA